MAIQKTEALVLKRQPFRTSSLIVTTFSRTFGKVKGIAKGVRREGMPYPSTFEPFTLIEIVYYEKIRSELHLISEAAILETFDVLRRDLEVLATAYSLVELVDQLTEPHDPHESIFNLLRETFCLLPNLSPSLVSRYFEIQLLKEVGLFPHLSGCLICGERELAEAYFTSRQGGIVCARCRRRAPEARVLKREVLEAMRSLAGLGAQAGENLRAMSQGIKSGVLKETGELIGRFLWERLSKRLPARRFLDQVGSLRNQSLNRQSSR